jgi:hypothetical protein
MGMDDFPHIVTALNAVTQCADGLLAGGEADHVRRSVDEIRTAFDARTAVEPAVARLIRSLDGLEAARRAGGLRAFNRGTSPIARLVDAIEGELLPALRRVGFHV